MKRAYAIEIIDWTCAHQVTHLVLPLVEDLSEAERRSRLARLAAVELLGLVPRLSQIIVGATAWTTGWMRACAEYTAERLGEEALAPTYKRASTIRTRSCARPRSGPPAGSRRLPSGRTCASA